MAATRPEVPPRCLLESRELEGNATIAIEDRECVWRVERGFVDLFRRGADGRRHFLLRAEAGDLMLGVLAGADFELLAVGGQRSAISVLTGIDALTELPRAATAAAIDRWLAAAVARMELSSELLERRAEPGRQRLLPGRRLEGPGDGALWATPVSGSAHFLGHQIQADGTRAVPVPLLRGTWIEAGSEAADVHAQTTTTLLEQTDPKAALLHFGALARDLIGARIAVEGAAEHADRDRRRDLSAQQVDSALKELLAIADSAGHGLDDAGATATLPPGATSDPTGLSTALAVISHHLGVKLGVPDQIPAADIEAKLHLDPWLRASRLRQRRVLLRDDWWKQARGPMLARRGEDSYVALIPIAGDRFELHEPGASLPRELSEADAATLLPEAHLFYQPLPDQPMTKWELARFTLRGGGLEGRRLMLASALAAMLGLATPIAAGLLVEHVIPAADIGQLWQVIALLIAIAFAISAFQLMQMLAMTQLQGRADFRLQAAVFDRLLRLPTAFYKRYNTGDLADRVLGINQIRQTLAAAGTRSLLGAIFAWFGLLLMFVYSWQLALIALALAAVSLTVTVTLSLRQLRHEREAMRHQGRVEGTTVQIISGINKLKIAGAEQRGLAHWIRLFARQKRLNLKAQRVANIQAVFQALFPPLATVAIFAAIASLTISSGIDAQLQALIDPSAEAGGALLTIGAFIAFNTAFAQFLLALTDMALALTGILGVAPLFERVRPVFDAIPETTSDRPSPGRVNGSIEFRGVSFRYQADGPTVLNDVSFLIRPGEYVAIVGASGSGKSTLFRMMMGFETPIAGEVFFDDRELRAIDVEALRRQLGVVLQTGSVAAGTIFSNIVGNAPFTNEDAWRAARLAGLDADIDAMPMGMHTVLQGGGGSLSGGQRQRLMIARALVHRPRILLMDEATSALDNRTQAVVTETLAGLDATRIVIAHRLSTIRAVERVLVMDHGRLVQDGPLDKLLETPGPLADLARRQMV